MKPIRRPGRRGNSIIEVTLMMPWILFLFVGVLDFGFYAYSFISTENAARAAALVTSRSRLAATDQVDACAVVSAEMKWAAYGRSFGTCNAAPLVVTATLLPNGGQDGKDAAQVEVKYTLLPMMTIPGVLNPGNQSQTGGLVIDRKWQMRIDPSADF